MAVINELIRAEENDTISFGNYELGTKSKVSDFKFQGDVYKVKTFQEITKLERNEMFVYESVPGTTVFNLKQDAVSMSFSVEGNKDAQITVEMDSETKYEVYIDGVSAGNITTNLGGKLSFSVELENQEQAAVKIVRC